jgi:hypothetical protein
LLRTKLAAALWYRLRYVRWTSRLMPLAQYGSLESHQAAILPLPLDFTIELVATEAKSPGSPTERLPNLVRVLTIWHTYNSQVAHVVLYQTGALTTAHLADVAAK